MSQMIAPSAGSATLPNSGSTAQASRESLLQYLQQAAKTMHRIELGVGITGWLTVLVLILLGAVLVDHWLWSLNGIARFAVLGAMIAWTAWWVPRRIIPLIFYSIHPEHAARRIESQFPEMKESLISWLQLSTKDNAAPRGVLATVGRYAVRNLGGADSTSVIDSANLIRISALLFGILLTGVIYLFVAPKSGMTSVARMVMPWANIAPAARVRILSVNPGTTTITQGTSVPIAVTVRGMHPGEQVYVRYDLSDGQQVGQRVRMSADIEGVNYQLNFGSSFGGVHQPLQYWIDAGDASVGPFSLSVQVVPIVAVDRVEYEYPAYTKLKPKTVLHDGQIEAPEGTRIKLYAHANQPMAKSRIEFEPLVENGTMISAARVMDLQTQETQIEGSWLLELDKKRNNPTLSSYRIKATNALNESNSDPIINKIKVLGDLPPEVRLQGDLPSSIEVPINGSLDIEIRASDPDFGLVSVAAAAKRINSNLLNDRKDVFAEPLFDSKVGRLGQVVRVYKFKPADHELKVGDRLEFRAVATDNRCKVGTEEPEPNKSVSSPIELKIVAGDPDANEAAGNQQNGEEPKAKDSPENKTNKPRNGKGNNASRDSKTSEDQQASSPDNPKQTKKGNESSNRDDQRDEKDKSNSAKPKDSDSNNGNSAQEKGNQDKSSGKQSKPDRSKQNKDSKDSNSSDKEQSEGDSQNSQGSGGGSDSESNQSKQSSQNQSGGGTSSKTSNRKDRSSNDSHSEASDASSEDSEGNSEDSSSEGSSGGSSSGASRSELSGRGATSNQSSEQDEPSLDNESHNWSKPDHDGEVFDRINQLREEREGNKAEQNQSSAGPPDPNQQSKSNQQGSDSQASEAPTNSKDASKENATHKQGNSNQPSPKNQNNTGKQSGDSTSENNSKEQGTGQQATSDQENSTKQQGVSDKQGETSNQSKNNNAQGENSKQGNGQKQNARDQKDKNSGKTEQQQGTGKENPGSEDTNSGEAQPKNNDGNPSETGNQEDSNSQDGGHESQGANQEGNNSKQEDANQNANGDKQSSTSKEPNGNSQPNGDKQGNSNKDKDGRSGDGNNKQGSGDKQSAGDKQNSGDKQGANNKQEAADKQGAGDKQGAKDQPGSNDKQGSGDKQNAGGAQGENSKQDAGNKQGASDKEAAGDQQGAGDKQNSGDKQGAKDQQGNGDQQGSADKQNTSGKQGENDKQGAGDKQGSAGKQDSGGSKSAGNQQSSNQQGDAGKAGAKDQQGDKQSNNNSNSPSANKKPNEGQSNAMQGGNQRNQGGTAQGGASGNGATQSSHQADAANLDYANKATDLALDYLKRQKDQPDPELLKRLNWTEKDMENFLKQWTDAKELAKTNAEKKKELDAALRSLGLRQGKAKERKTDDRDDDLKGLLEEGSRVRPPDSLRERFEQFRKAANRME